MSDERTHVQSTILNVTIFNRPSLLGSLRDGPYGSCFWCEVDFGSEDDEDEDLQRVEAFCTDSAGDGIFDGMFIHRYCDSERADRSQLLWPHDAPEYEWYESPGPPGSMMTDHDVSYEASDEYDVADSDDEDVAFNTPTHGSAPAAAGTPGAKSLGRQQDSDETVGGPVALVSKALTYEL